MEVRFAKFISYLLHPVFMPVYGLLLLFGMKSYFTFDLVLEAKLILLSFVAVTTIFFPLLVISLLKKMGVIADFYMKSREERRVPYLVVAVFYFLTYQMLRPTQLPEIYSFYFMGATFLLAVVVIINFWWKISIHMVGTGGMCGMLCGMALANAIDLALWIAVSFLVCGFVGYARLKLEAHKSSEVYSGFLVGFLILFTLYLLV